MGSKGFAPVARTHSDPFVDELGYSAVWLSHNDCVQFIDKCITVNLRDSFLILNAVSDNRPVLYDISTARTLLDFRPLDGVGKLD